MAYVVGAAIVLAACISVNGYCEPFQAMVIPLVWWVFFPRRGWAIAATAFVSVMASVGLMWSRFNQFFETWPMWKRVVDAGVFPVVIVVIAAIAGTWVGSVFRWGRERTELVENLRTTEEQRIAFEREAAVAEERLRLSREIHDTIAQDAAGCGMAERVRLAGGSFVIESAGPNSGVTMRVRMPINVPLPAEAAAQARESDE